MTNILIIGSVWPEPNSSAAGSRMLQLLELLIAKNWKITFVSAASDSSHMFAIETLGITRKNIQLNNNSFDQYISKLQPNIVIFDRFMTEEQFGWRVSKHCPKAARILNTEDLHCLRKTRQASFKKNIEFQYSDLLVNDITKREIASIYRCDISLIISDFEIKLLKEIFNIPKQLLFYIPLLYKTITKNTIDNWPLFEDRKHFTTIGNFRHEPNWNSVLYLKETIWPLIRKELPKTELHIYGAYPPPKAMQLHTPKKGFHIKGWAKDATEVMKNARVCLAPLRFGAGIKGKLTEAMLCGTPSITTSIGKEGMTDSNSNWNGFIKDTPEEFAKAAIKLYTEESIWHQSQKNGINLINTRFQKEKFESKLIEKLENLLTNIDKHRSQNFIGSMLLHHTLKSTEYMAKWIEEKNKIN